MKSISPNVKKGIAVAALVVAALLSAFVLAGRLSDPAFHAASIAALDEKKVTVTELTAAVAGGFRLSRVMRPRRSPTRLRKWQPTFCWWSVRFCWKNSY